MVLSSYFMLLILQFYDVFIKNYNKLINCFPVWGGFPHPIPLPEGEGVLRKRMFL